MEILNRQKKKNNYLIKTAKTIYIISMTTKKQKENRDGNEIIERKIITGPKRYK